MNYLPEHIEKFLNAVFFIQRRFVFALKQFHSLADTSNINEEVPCSTVRLVHSKLRAKAGMPQKLTTTGT